MISISTQGSGQEATIATTPAHHCLGAINGKHSKKRNPRLTTNHSTTVSEVGWLTWMEQWWWFPGKQQDGDDDGYENQSHIPNAHIVEGERARTNNNP